MNGLINAAIGVLTSALYGSFSYAIAHVKNGEDFNSFKFGKFLVIGFIVGLFSSAFNIDMTTADGLSISTLASIIVDKIAGSALKQKQAS